MVCKIPTRSAEKVDNENILENNIDKIKSANNNNMNDTRNPMKLQHLAGGNLITHPPLFAANGDCLFLLKNKTINVYSTSTGEHVGCLSGATDKLISMQLELQQEHILVACSESGEVLRWHWESGKLTSKQNLKLTNAQIITFNLLNLYHNSESALAFVTVRYKGAPVKWVVYDTTTGYAVNVPMEMRLTYKNTMVDVDSTNFKFLVIAQEHYLYFVDYAKWTWRRMKNPLEVPVTVVRCHPKEAAVATGDELGKIFIWRNFMCNTTVDTSLYHWHHTAVTSLAFSRHLARLLRRSSAVSVAAEQPSHAAVQSSRGGSASSKSLRRTSDRAEIAAIGAVDPEISFNMHKSHYFAVCTRNGARLGNEDRFRAIDNLDLYGRGLLEVAPRTVPSFFGDLLKHRVLENFVVEGRAPALKVRNLLKHLRVNEDTQFFGVYDGHGGARASSLLALLFPVYILAAPEFKNDLAAACHSASMAINEEILKREKDGHCEGGATAVTLLIRGNTFVLSNTGDCRAIMVAKRDKVPQVTQLTTDHKASNDQEKQRIEENGGMVLYVKGVARVNGRLAVARAFGDAELSQLVIADPEVTVHELHREDEYIVMASDGLWDVLTNEQVASCIRNNPWLNVQEMANMLADRAVELGTLDNVTVMVVDVRGRVS